MRSCDIELRQFLNLTQPDLPEEGHLFHCPYVTLAIEEDNAALERVLNAAHRALLNMEEEEDSDTVKSAENLTGFCNLLANLKPAKCNDFLDSLQYLISLLPPVESLTDRSSYSRCQTFQHHVWLLLSTTRALVAARYLPTSLDTYWNILDESLGSLLSQSFSRVTQTKDSALTLVSEKRSIFSPPQTFASCECVEVCWKFVISKISEVSTDHVASNLRFWDLFNKHFNSLVCSSDNTSGLMWILEQIITMVTSTCPNLPSNWSIVQELTKLSCVNPAHLKQTLISLTKIGELWPSNIVIVMTLQQHFARSLNSRSSSLVPVLSPHQYSRTSESIVKLDTLTEDTMFQHFLRFYSRGLDKIPEVKRVTLIRRLFQSEKWDHKSLATMSAESLQNLGLLVGCCLLLIKPDSLTAQVNKMFGSLSGDIISNSSSPNVVVSLQIGMTLSAVEVGLDSQLLLEQLTIMLNRISEDYVRESDSRKCQIFGVFSKMLNDLECLAGSCKFDSVMFLGTWVEMFLTEGDPQRSGKVLKFCQFVIDKANVNDTSVAMVSKFVVKPIQKFIKSRNQDLQQCFNIAADVLAKLFLILHQNDNEKQKNIRLEIFSIATPPNCPYSLASEFLYRTLQQSNITSHSDITSRLILDHQNVMANVVFTVMCTNHVRPQEFSNDTDKLEKFSVLLQCLFDCPHLAGIKPELQNLSPQKEGLVLDFVSLLTDFHQNMPFSDGQLFKSFVWKMFESVPETLTTTLVGHTVDDGRCKRLYQLVAHMFLKIPNLLYNPSRPNSPILVLFQTFVLKREQQNKLQMFLVLPNIFWGLSRISYRSNNLFLKHIMKVFDEVYAQAAKKDWSAGKQDPFLVSLFTSSFAEEVEDSVRSFRQVLMDHIREPAYCKLPNTQEDIAGLLYFISKLEQSTKDRALLLSDFTKLYPFLLQVLYCSLRDKSRQHIKHLVSDIFRHFFKQTNWSEDDLTSVTANFISQNANVEGGPVSLVETFKCLMEFGALEIVTNSLESLESALHGRAYDEFILLKEEVLRCQ
ncbi:uncharacterized protein LOC134826308 [Bolinopsis microptera]|uniref:uncharacterized protein LOC134826308 n=1 Tax=Bolinopsis microptera TaxID=2820187 RepID=UPI00307A15BC